MGIISIPTLGLLAVGAIASIALGAIALSRIKKEPMIYGGKGMAIAGIITSIIRFIESKAAGAVRRDEGTPSNQQR